MDLNPRDYRAWYGLGQTYELLHMPYHALYYFRCSAGPRQACVLWTAAIIWQGRFTSNFLMPCKALYQVAEAVCGCKAAALFQHLSSLIWSLVAQGVDFQSALHDTLWNLFKQGP